MKKPGDVAGIIEEEKSASARDKEDE